MDGGGTCVSSCQDSPRKRKKPSRLSSSSSWITEESCDIDDQSPTWVYMTVWVAGVLVYVNGLTGELVHDDVSAIKTNPDVLGTNPLSHAFFNDYWGKPMCDPLSHKSYRPFTIITFRINHSLFGLRPLGFHLVNVLLHSCVCLLLTRLLLRLLHLPQGTVLSAGLIFATHPVHTEAVTGLVGRADVLASITFLAALLSYHRAIETNVENREGEDGLDNDKEPARRGTGGVEGRRGGSISAEAGNRSCGFLVDSSRRDGTRLLKEEIGGGGGGGDEEWVWMVRVGVLTGVGTLCKEHAITALLACGAWDLILHRKHISRVQTRHSLTRLLRALLRRVYWLCFMGGVVLVFRVWMLSGTSPSFSDQDNPAAFAASSLTRLLTFLYLPAFNAWLLVCPWRLAHDWQTGAIPLLTSPADPRNLATLLFYAALVLILRAACLTKCQEGRPVLLGLALLVLPFLPATNLLFSVGFVVAERILYLPRAGLRTLPNNAKMHYNFANLQKDLGNTELAKHHYAEAIRLWPTHSSAHNNLGTLVTNASEAEQHFWLALEAHPRHARAFYNLASLRLQQGRVEEAVVLLEESLRCDATNRDVVSTLAGLYRDTGRAGQAQELHLALLDLRPADPAVHTNFALFLQRMGRGEAALLHYQVALGLDPHHKMALLNTAKLLRKLHHDVQAELLYKRALAESWELETGESLGTLYLNTGRLEAAEAVFATVLTHHPHTLSSRLHLARVKLHQRGYQESEELLQEVLSQDPTNLEALFQLSLLYTYTNHTHDALAIAHHAAHNCSRPASLCARLHAHYGDLLSDRHSNDQATQNYLLAVELEPTLTHAHVNLGALYHTKGDYGRAWRHYLAAQEQDPSNALLLENMEKLHRAQHLSSHTSILHCINKS
nr:protein O-mannosyl-transferase TMTC1-like [Procambarus clarkii]